MGMLVYGSDGFGIGRAAGLEAGVSFGGGTVKPSLILSSATMVENLAAGASVGTLSVSNAPDGVTYTYALTSNPGSLFAIDGEDLETAQALDYETATSHTVEITATGSDASSIVKSFTVSVVNVGSAPIVLTYASPAQVAEDAFAADVVVTFSASSADSSDTFNYELDYDLGPELCVNKDFDGNISGWTENSTAPGYIDYDDVTGGLRLVHGGGSNHARALQEVPTVIGNTYALQVSNNAASDRPIVVFVNNVGELGAVGVGQTSTFYFEAVDTTAPVGLRNFGSSGEVVYCDLASVREVGNASATNFEIVGDELRVATGATLTAGDTHPITVRVTATDGTFADEVISVGVVAGGPDIADVFSTDLWTGTSSPRTITNGLNFTDEGGLAWIKSRSASYNNTLLDTNKDLQAGMSSNRSTGVFFDNLMEAYTTTGYRLWDSFLVNNNGHTYVGWAFRNAPRFFTSMVVSHPGGSDTTLDLAELGTVGMVTAVRMQGGSWYTWHRGMTPGSTMFLNLDNSEAASTLLSVSGTTATLSSGAAPGSYVVYAWAHSDSDSGVIQCVEVTTNASGAVAYTHGWAEGAQYVMAKCASSSGSWEILDTARSPGWVGDVILSANSSSNELTPPRISGTGTTITLTGLSANERYILMLIRGE